MTEPTPTTLITEHKQLERAMENMEQTWARIPVVDPTGSCLDYVLVPITPAQAGEMLREARAHTSYNMCLSPTNVEDVLLLEIVDIDSAA